MKKVFLSLATLIAFAAVLAAPAWAETTPLGTHVLGNPNAPVVIEDYASLTCSHCATFYNEVLPELEKRYVSTGKVAFIFRDFPLNGIDLKASALAHCMPAEQYHSFVRILYKNSAAWTQNPEKILVQYARLGGMEEEKAKECMADTKMMDALVAARSEAASKYNVGSTPTFIFNKGQEKLVGARDINEFARVIDKMIGK